MKTPQIETGITPILSQDWGARLVGFFGRVLTVLVVFVLVTESLARLPWLDAVSPYRSLGLWYYPFDIKWYRLEQYIQQHGSVDVIILGSSLVNTGIIPEKVAQAYQDETGVALKIFNFGIDGMTIAPNSQAAKILIENYHPQLLIFVTEIRDYDAYNGLKVQEQFLSNHWIGYKLGRWDLTGWAIDHSKALQHYLVYRNWMTTQFSASLSAYWKKLDDVSPTGYEAEYARMGQAFDASAALKEPLALADSRLGDLKNILHLGQTYQTQIMIMEMPVDMRIYQNIGGANAQIGFQNEISQIVQAGGGLFLPADNTLIPLSGRSNPQHLNFRGAPILSGYLGKQLAALFHQQKLHFSDTSQKPIAFCQNGILKLLSPSMKIATRDEYAVAISLLLKSKSV